MYRIGIDIGGTFTDLVAVDESGVVTIAKYPTTPVDQSIGLVEGLGVLAAELGITRDKLLAETALIIHGTTAATNALLERKGSKVGMLTTAGFRDVIEQREGLKPDRYNLRLPPEPVLVPRSLRLPVGERIRFDGRTEIELDERSVCDAIAVFKREGVNAVAVCCLHSYADPSNERRIRDILSAEMPDAYVCLSSDVLPQIKEFERFSTTVVNAFVGPILSNYMNRLRGRLKEAGYDGDVLIMHSHGGLATIDDSIDLGAGCVLSGPAGGIAGACYAAEITSVRDLITFDGEGAHRVVGEIAKALGVETIEAAEGILRVINMQMAEGIRIVAVRAGTDPRNYTLLSFGGAAGLHITDIARILGVKRVIIPRPAAVLSAWGMLATDLRYDYVRTAVGEIRRIGADPLRILFREMENEGRERVARAGDFAERIEVIRSLDMRYGEQIFEINVPLKNIDLVYSIAAHPARDSLMRSPVRSGVDQAFNHSLALTTRA